MGNPLMNDVQLSQTAGQDKFVLTAGLPCFGRIETPSPPGTYFSCKHGSIMGFGVEKVGAGLAWSGCRSAQNGANQS
jgi:hypothetical protein